VCWRRGLLDSELDQRDDVDLMTPDGSVNPLPVELTSEQESSITSAAAGERAGAPLRKVWGDLVRLIHGSRNGPGPRRLWLRFEGFEGVRGDSANGEQWDGGQTRLHSVALLPHALAMQPPIHTPNQAHPPQPSPLRSGGQRAPALHAALGVA